MIILPRWFVVLEDLSLSTHMMPCNVSTQWNSTFDMLDFAVNYHAALDTITSECNMKLWQFELSEEDWGTAVYLHDVLKVHIQIFFFWFFD